MIPRTSTASGESSVQVCALGTPVSVRFSGSRADEAAEAFRDAWAWCITEAVEPPASDPVVIDASLEERPDVDHDSRGRRSDVSALMQQLSSLVTTRAITAQAGRMLMLHACALADPETGATVVMVGPSGMGKTTVARTFGTSWGYVTDETAGVCLDKTVLPYPKPLSLLRADAHGVKDQVAPAKLGLTAPPDRCRLASMILLERSVDAPVVPHVQRVRTVRAMAELGAQTSYLGRMVKPLHLMADVLDHCGGLLRVTYREAEDLRPLVKDVLGRAG